MSLTFATANGIPVMVMAKERSLNRPEIPAVSTIRTTCSSDFLVASAGVPVPNDRHEPRKPANTADKPDSCLSIATASSGRVCPTSGCLGLASEALE